MLRLNIDVNVPSLDKTDSFGSTSTSTRLSELIRTRQNTEYIYKIALSLCCTDDFRDRSTSSTVSILFLSK